MASTDPYGRGPSRPNVALDYLDLFTEAAPWPTVAGRVDVLKVGTSFIAFAPDEVLRRAFSDLKRRNIALAWEAAVIPRGASCGAGIEGYAGDTASWVARIKAAGGELAFVAMDEPLWYGHTADVPHSCRLSLPELARGVAAQLAIIRNVFPDVQVGDIEPVGTGQGQRWAGEIAAWADALREATGQPLRFFHADMNWSAPWEKEAVALRDQLRDKSVPLGVIFNGELNAATDSAWNQQAIDHFQQIEDVLGIHPEAAIFQTWVSRPHHLLPEQQPGTLTNLILQLTRPPASIDFRRTPNGVSGRVTDEDGHPMSGVRVVVSAVDTLGIGGLSGRTRNGTVPAEAASALFGLRLNVECFCGGPADITVGQMRYREIGKEPVTRMLSEGTDPARITSAPGEAVAINTAAFPVTAGAEYQVDLALRAGLDSLESGYLAIFFLGKDGHELERDVVRLNAEEQIVGKAMTDQSGQFASGLAGGLPWSRVTIRSRVLGSQSIRPTVKQIGPEAE